jgi:hypothetical protein
LERHLSRSWRRGSERGSALIVGRKCRGQDIFVLEAEFGRISLAFMFNISNRLSIFLGFFCQKNML